MNTRTLLLTASVIILGAVSTLPASVAFAGTDVSIDRADSNGGDKVSPDKTGSKDTTADKTSIDGQGDNSVSNDSTGSNDLGKPMQLHASARAATANSGDRSIDTNSGDKASPDKTGSKDGSADKTSKDGTGSKDSVSKDGSNTAATGKAGKGEGHNHR